MLRNVIKTVAWLVFLAAFLVVIAFVGIFHFGLLEFGINRQLKEIVGAKAPVDVTIGAIEGDYFSVLEVRDVQVQYNDGTLSYPLAEIPRIRAMYSLADIWRGKLDVSALVIDSA
ncbi:MAG: hypothetical protein ACE5GA_03755, partial [Candidatus Zixiibacteriota bacterium]